MISNDNKKKRIVLTGGGTAGHVTPNLALLPKLREEGFEVLYIGSYNGIEKKLMTEAGVPYKGISSGKLRRYIDIKNLTDPARVVKGYVEARHIIRKYKPDVIFSKGGFVAVPVVLAAARLRVPVISHESDMTPGLANKIAMPASKKICCNFPETLKYLPEGKGVLSGSPIREEILTGSREEGLRLSGFSGEKPVIMVIGGSMGAVRVNEAVRKILPELLKDFDIIHICGKGNVDESLSGKDGYRQFEYVGAPLKDLFAASDMMISRAGANSICEILALKKPSILIPLSKEASRGDQILNAGSFEKNGYSVMIEEENLTDGKLLNSVRMLYEDREKYIKAMENSSQQNGVKVVMELIKDTAAKSKRRRLWI